MIDRFQIDPTKGGADQVGLFIAATDEVANQFNALLRQGGFSTRELMRSVRPAYTHFTYVGLTSTRASKQRVQQLLQSICEREVAQAAADNAQPTTYDEWKTAFNGFVQAYRAQRLTGTAPGIEETFDKRRAYQLIQASQFEAAEKYLNRFATDAPPPLVPEYLVYLYHTWNQPTAVVGAYNRYSQRLTESDLPVQVVEWIAAACLRTSPPNYELTLVVLDTFLPDFQRQGVAEPLLALRAQARAAQGQLPSTLTELQDYLAQTPVDILAGQLENLLQIITGLTTTPAERGALLDTLQLRISEPDRWRVIVARSEIAQQAGTLEVARQLLGLVLTAPPVQLSPVDMAELLLTAANLSLQSGEPAGTLEHLAQISQVDLGPDAERTYWSLSGQAQLMVGDPSAALDALQRAYDLGATSPAIIQPLARQAYQARESERAFRLYSQLQLGGFQPSSDDLRISGLLTWLNGEPAEALPLLQQGLADPTLDQRSIDPTFYEAYAESLRATGAPAETLIAALQGWTDVLAAQSDTNGIQALIHFALASSLSPAEQYLVLEATELLSANNSDLRALLVEAYETVLSAELSLALRGGTPLPGYILSLRRGLFALDRQRFDYAQQMLDSELARYREAHLAEHEYTLLPPEQASTLNLAGRQIALVGGYEPVRRRVREILARDFGLTQFSEVPPSWEAHVNERRVSDAVQGADLIVVMHRVIKHDGTNTLDAVIAGTPLQNRVRYARGKGHSSVLALVREYFRDAN